jgi:hypothetical protein
LENYKEMRNSSSQYTTALRRRIRDCNLGSGMSWTIQNVYREGRQGLDEQWHQIGHVSDPLLFDSGMQAYSLAWLKALLAARTVVAG